MHETFYLYGFRLIDLENGLIHGIGIPTTAQQCRSATKKNILVDLFSSVLPQFKKYHPSGNMKFNYLGIFQNLKLRILMGKILSISLKLNFTPNTSGCYGLIADGLVFFCFFYQ